jgi:hypothetical protein
MMGLHNAKERDQNDWRNLFAEADPSFEFVQATPIPGAEIGIIEAKWNP